MKARTVREVAPPFFDLTTGTDDFFPKSGGDITCSSRRYRASPPRSNFLGDNGVPRRLRSSFVTKVSERVGSTCDLAD